MVAARQAGFTSSDTLRGVKLLAFDLDGTVVTREQGIPDTIRSAINRVRSMGHVVTVLTGRTETSARPFLDMLEVRVPYATAQGAMVSHADGSVMFAARLAGETVQDVLGTAEAESFFVATGTQFFVPEPAHPRWEWAWAEGHAVSDYQHYAGQSALKIMLAARPDEFADLIPAPSSEFEGRHLLEIHARLHQRFPALSYYPWQGRFLEVTAPDAHKGAALERIATSLGILRKDVIAFGDGHNDLTMLEWAGRAVAVGEFEAHHAGVADETIPPPEEHGVATWLEANL
jgi:Cof subfamily protein (haloacid dehalogenase superfamily)